ncbi:helix-turn-helix domain-containing protein [Lentibacillus amyloliquefaciens]|uniref:Helicase Helix-turn-helix domain-containing protein n=1 Tax=Lentibacillus amyloliquefaciens TaxID=1472767 RepID=A0A0U4FBW6_9BACI|nr:helix-turn-helix domain-containing protein [Lentibacillus amyloliquefaciens]ALX47981.1 hypothetical protein AOX59_04790 [Lentibacillus amyloliquefaciens]
MLFNYIILSCCSKFRGDRSTSAVFHLLKGKRSIQTVQDAHIYELNHFYGIYPTLLKQDFDARIHHLIKNDTLLLSQENTAIPTSKGNSWLKQHAGNIPDHYFNGMEYCRHAPVFWERLILMIQTMTNSKQHYFNFIPVIDKTAVTEWVKKQYHLWKNNKSSFLNQLYGELFQLLEHFHKKEANIFVDSLTGYNHYGMSSFQLAERYGLEKVDVPLIRTSLIHRMLMLISQNESMNPLFMQFLQDLPDEAKLTNSANKTKNFMDRGYAAEDIAAIRRLKLNTIYDHMVEIALYDTFFPLGQYVNPDEQDEIRTAIKKTNSYKLKDIKQNADETISYFQIRLVLATDKIT